MTTLTDLRARLQQEEEAAAPLVQRVQDPAFWDAPVHAADCTLGAVHALTSAAREHVERDPSVSVTFAHAALLIASQLTGYPRVLLARATAAAWRELGTAHRYQARFDAAARALARATAVLEEEPALGYDRTVIVFARAILAAEQEHHEEALALLAHARASFLEYHDDHRVAQCLLLAGMISTMQGNLVVARASFAEAIERFTTTTDTQSLASAYHNLGHVLVDLQEHDAALAALHRANALFLELDLPLEQARTMCVLARLHRDRGSFTQAHEIFTLVARTFRDAGMPVQAGVALLDDAETLLGTNQVVAAHDAAGAALELFLSAKLPSGAQTALAYLRQTISGGITAPAVRHVRAYVERLPAEPTLLFAHPE